MEYLGFTYKGEDGERLNKVYKEMEQIIDNLKSGEEKKEKVNEDKDCKNEEKNGQNK